MTDVWLYTPIGMLIGAGALLSAAVWSSARVLGRIAHVERSLLLLVTQVEQLDERLTREVKQRAANVRVENAQEERSLAQQASAHLAEHGASVVPLERPKRPMRRR